MSKKDFNTFIEFEKITSYLLEADHDRKIKCVYGVEIRERQFDGYKELKYNEILEPIKIGIECKNYNSSVPIEKVEAFKTKIERCNINKGIMVSFKGFQSGAIAEAKLSNIDLIEFRRCRESDFIDEQGNPILMQINIETTSISPSYKLRFNKIRVLTNNLTDSDIIKLKSVEKMILEPIYCGIYNEKGIYIGNLLDLISNLNLDLEDKRYNGEEVKIPVNWEDKKNHIIIKWNDQIIHLELLHFTIIVNFIETKESTIIGSNNPNDWFIMRNIIDKNEKLIFKAVVESIQNKYGIID